MLRCIFLLVALWVVPLTAQARCTLRGATNVADGASAQIPLGRLNLTDNYLQPVGSLLGSVVVPPTNYTYNGANAATVLWECDAADLPSLYFLVATNGDDRVGGRWELGANDGLPDVYATWFTHVGIRQTMSGVVLSRYWKAVPLQSYAQVGTKVRIRLQDVPSLLVEAYKISGVPPVSPGTNYCVSMGVANATGQLYTCTQPNAYVQLVGPNLISDQIGRDSAFYYDFWGVNNGFGYGMRGASALSSNASCVARTASPHVLLPTLTVQALRSGAVSQAEFSVQLECSDNVNSGTSGGQTAIGLQVSPAAYANAQALGLVNAAGGVEALLPDVLDTAGQARGVGFFLEELGGGGRLPFVGQPGTTGSVTSGIPSGRAAGWLPVLESVTAQGSSLAGYRYYQRRYQVVLKALPEQVPTPGRVTAIAYVLVKVQ